HADLAHEARPGVHALAAEDLDAAPLAVAVAPVARAPLAFLVSHRSALDAFDLDLGVGLPVALLAPVALAPLHLEDEHLRGAVLRGDRADHARAGDERGPHALGAFAAEQQDLAELDAVADRARELLDAD